jgi:hypothetical protein
MYVGPSCSLSIALSFLAAIIYMVVDPPGENFSSCDPSASLVDNRALSYLSTSI